MHSISTDLIFGKKKLNSSSKELPKLFNASFEIKDVANIKQSSPICTLNIIDIEIEPYWIYYRTLWLSSFFSIQSEKSLFTFFV